MRTCSRSYHLIFGLILAFASIAVPAAHAQHNMGELMVTGTAKLNGQPAATGDTVSSGNTVQTAQRSSAVVSLGKLGRVEALPETMMKLSYSGDSIAIELDSGSVRVSTGPGVSATIVRKKE